MSSPGAEEAGFGCPAAEVAVRSAAHLYHRLKLTALAPELRKAFYAVELSVTGAFLIARGMPTALQPEGQEVCTDAGCWREEVAAFIDRERRDVLATDGCAGRHG